MRVVIIGAGLSSALISVLLRGHYGPGIKLVVYDKSKSIGGRMKTSYESEENHGCSVDIGAQYLSVTKSNDTATKLFQHLIDGHVLELFDNQKTIGLPEVPDEIDYTAPHGIVSVVKYFFEKAAVEINLSKHITKIDLNSSNDKFLISTDEEQLDESEAVIVTAPVPQVLTQLRGYIAQLIDDNKDVKDKLVKVKYYSRFAVGLFYPPSVTSLNVPWRIYCLNEKEHEVLRFLVVDNAKRNKDGPPFSLLAHTSVDFGAKHIEEDEKVVGEQIKEELFKFLPDLPREISNAKYHKWEYCQIMESYPDSPGCLVLKEHPLLVLAGDSFATDSTIEPCIEAAVEAVKRIIAVFA